jgi:hypothetical protein
MSELRQALLRQLHQHAPENCTCSDCVTAQKLVGAAHEEGKWCSHCQKTVVLDNGFCTSFGCGYRVAAHEEGGALKEDDQIWIPARVRIRHLRIERLEHALAIISGKLSSATNRPVILSWDDAEGIKAALKEAMA